MGTLALRLGLCWILGEAEVGSLYPNKGKRESFKVQKLMRELALQYPRATQGGDSHHCGKGRGREILSASPLAPKTYCGWTHRHLLLVSYLILWLPGWSQSEFSRRQAEQELPHYLF